MNKQTRQAKARHASHLMRRANVVGVTTGYKVTRGVATQTESLVILVRKKLPAAILAPDELIPQRLDEVVTDVVEIGEVRAQALQGGDSCGHYKITAGTAGVIVIDKATEQRLILSNNHVLANENEAHAGDFILAPGPMDGGTIKDNTVAYLTRWQHIFFGNDQPAPPGPLPPVDECQIANTAARVANAVANAIDSRFRLLPINVAQLYVDAAVAPYANTVDAAVARMAEGVPFAPGVQDIGQVEGQLDDPQSGTKLQKYGRTTEYTQGTMLYDDALIDISYGSKVARFDNQIIANNMSAPGDSGSLVLDLQRRAVGLLFAGSDTITVLNPIAAVLAALNVSLELA